MPVATPAPSTMNAARTVLGYEPLLRGSRPPSFLVLPLRMRSRQEPTPLLHSAKYTTTFADTFRSMTTNKIVTLFTTIIGTRIENANGITYDKTSIV